MILSPCIDNIELAAKLLNNGDVVAFPTETIYGLGANAYDDQAVLKIFLLKKRKLSNSLTLCYPNIEAAFNDVIFTNLAFKMAEKFLPGPLTIVLKRKTNSKISKYCSSNNVSIGIRIPNHPIINKLMNFVDFPITATSANISSYQNTYNAYEVKEQFSEISVIDGGKCSIAQQSTILDCSDENDPQILRNGAINKEEIMQHFHH